MKNILFLSALVCVGLEGFCQADSTAPVYLRFPTIPQFTVYRAPDSSTFSREDLQKRKPVVFMIFSPDCEHCQRETDTLLANIGKFKNAQILMITIFPYEQMVEFYKKYKIADYPQIIMARDTKYFFHPFFKVRNFPSFFIYDKKGDFRKNFEGTVKIDSVAEAL